MGMRAIADPDYGLVSVFMTSAFVTVPGVSAAAGRIGEYSHAFGTMAAAAISSL
jgi:hypothetical protein